MREWFVLRHLSFFKMKQRTRDCKLTVTAVCIWSLIPLARSAESPKIQPFNFHSAVEAGGKTTMTCAVVKGDLPLEFSWTKDGNDIPKLENIEISSHTKFSVLVIDPVLSEDRGNYTCNVKNYHGTDSFTASLTVEDPPSWLIEPQDMEVAAGVDIDLRCAGRGSPKPTTQWSVHSADENKPLPPPGEVLKLSGISIEDGGKYVCTISNGIGEDLRKEITLKVLGDAPKIQPFVPLQKISEGETVKILCSIAKGEKPLQFRWLKNGSQMKNGERIEISVGKDSSILTINEVHALDSGNYTCLVENIFGQANYSASLIVEAPPRWIVEPKDLDALLGERVHLDCSVSGYPPPLVSWSKIEAGGDGEAVNSGNDAAVSNGTLILSSVGDDDNGKYQCLASNGVGKTLKKAVTITVLADPPKIAPFVFPPKIAAGDNTKVLCSAARGEQPFHFQWFKDGTLLKDQGNTEIATLKDSSILTISALGDTDSGNYTCVLRNKHGVENHTALLIVEAPPRWIFEPKDVDVRFGSEIQLDCKVSGFPPPVVIWRKVSRGQKAGSVIGGEEVTSRNGSLIFSSVSHTDEGSYECTASNGIGNSLGKVVTLTVLGNIPVIQPYTFQSTLSEGDSTKVLCMVIRGESPLQFEWYKDGQKIKPDENVQIQTVHDNSILVIRHLSAGESGNYTCVVRNTAGVANYTTVVIVEAPPKWISQPENVEVILGNSASLNCRASGYPYPVITWKKLNGNDVNGIQEHVISEDGTLHIEATALEDGATYVCQAENGVGPVLTKTASLHILVPAKFEEKFAVVSSKRGDSTSLKCEATGDQPLSIVWKKDMVELSKSGGSRYEIFETLLAKGLKSELVIRETERTDSSMYSCTAENPYGQDDRTMKLLVLEVPAKPLDVKVMDVWSRSVSVKWSSPYTGNSPITQYVVQFWRDQGAPHRLQEKEVTSSQTSTLIKELKPGTNYALTVVAENAVGRGESSNSVSFTTGEEEPSGAPVDVSVEAKGSSSLFVTWKDPPRSDWNGQLKGYYVGYKVHDSTQPYSFKTLEYTQNEEHEHMITNLRKDTEYKVVVKAFNAAGSGPASQDILVRTLGGDLPSPPVVFIATTTDTSIKVQWRAQESRTPIKGHVIHYRKKSEKWQQIPVLTPTENSFPITGLESGVFYQLYVTSANEFGEGDPSEVLNVKTSARDKFVLISGGQEAPFYLDLSLLVPVAASLAAVVVVIIVVCIWVQKARGRRNLDRALRDEKNSNYSTQRYVDIEKSRPYPYPDSDLSSNYPTPYATVPMRDDSSEGRDDPHQEMKSFLPQNMKDRPLPVPVTTSSLKKKEAHIYDSPQ